MAHTTRAYMSLHEWQDSWPSVFQGDVLEAEWEARCRPERALEEASRILADVERPSVERQHYDWSCFETSGYQAHRMFSMAPGEREALAESLSAFVNDGGRA